MDELLDDVQDSLQFDDIPTVNSNNPVKSGGIYSALSNKQDTLNFDNQPTSNSQRMLTSGSIYTALSTKQNTLTIANSVQQGNSNPVSSGAVYTAIQGLTPEGDLIVVDDELSSTSENPVQNKVIYNALEEKVDNSELANYATTSSLFTRAPTSHASSTTTYGIGTDSNYGHLKITDNATNTAATSGIAISPKAVYNLTQTVNGKQNTLSSDNPLPVSSGGTGATSFTAGGLLIGNGTNAVETRAITNNTSNTAAVASTNIPNMNTLYYTLAKINNADQTHATAIYAPTAGGTANTQALVGNGTTTAPKWVDISPTVEITPGDSTHSPKINISVLGQSATAQAITDASTSTYGVTKLTDSYLSNNSTLAATGKSIYAALQLLDVSSVGGSGKYISAISETDGKISATATNTSVSNTWTDGTTAGPTIQTTVNGVAGTAVVIPKASDTTSGIVTTDTQYFRGPKAFERIIVRAKEQNDTSSPYRRFASIQFWHNQNKIAGTIAIDTVGSGGRTFSTNVNYSYSRWQFEEYSPKTTPDAESTGYAEIYKLPAAAAGLTAHQNYDILTSKNTITIAQGGTGLTASPSMLVNLSSTSAANVLQASPRPGITGTLGVTNGGTGVTSLQALRNAAGLGNTTGALPVANGGTGTTSKTGIIQTIFGDSTTGGSITPDYFLGITQGWTTAGYITVANTKKLLGIANNTIFTSSSSKPKVLLTVSSDTVYPRVFLIVYRLLSENGIQQHCLMAVQYAENSGIMWPIDNATSFPSWVATSTSFKINFSEAATGWVLGSCNFTASGST